MKEETIRGGEIQKLDDGPQCRDTMKSPIIWPERSVAILEFLTPDRYPCNGRFARNCIRSSEAKLKLGPEEPTHVSGADVQR